MKSTILPIAVTSLLSCAPLLAEVETETAVQIEKGVPGAAVVQTTKVKATIKFEDGSTKEVAVRKDVDLSKRKVGEKLVIQTAESLAILIEKP